MDLTEFQKILTLTSVTVFLLCLAFDVIVSYSVYCTHREYFLNMERNDEFKRLVTGSMLPKRLITQSLLVFSMPLVFYFLELRFRKNIFSYLLIMSVSIALLAAFGHLNGGMSWWRL